jgi:hypothetical protein
MDFTLEVQADSRERAWISRPEAHANTRGDIISTRKEASQRESFI